MSARTVVPVADMHRRLPTAGRLRFGDKSGKNNAPKAIDKWRATSHDHTAIDQLAATYGGTPRTWAGAPGRGEQWEVYTDTAELAVLLPPEPLGGGPVYELWSGGGCQRRCDGETCVTTQPGPDGPEPAEVACICDAKSRLECQVKTRLNVILPDVRFGGVWRLDTSSWNAAHELPGMVDMIAQLQAAGRITRALLRLERESKPGKSYVVPRLGLAETATELVAGDAAVGALAEGSQVTAARALEAGSEWFDEPTIDDDGVVDAEIVDEEPDAPSQKQIGLLHQLLTKDKAGVDWSDELVLSDDEYRALLEAKWGVRSSKALSRRQVSEVIDVLADGGRRAAAVTWVKQRAEVTS